MAALANSSPAQAVAISKPVSHSSTTSGALTFALATFERARSSERAWMIGLLGLTRNWLAMWRKKKRVPCLHARVPVALRSAVSRCNASQTAGGAEASGMWLRTALRPRDSEPSLMQSLC